MNKTVAVQLLCYGGLLIGLSLLVNHLAPESARTTLVTGLVGGGCCLAWSIWAIGGRCGKTLPVLTVVPVSFALLSQTVMIWADHANKGPRLRAAAIVVTLLFAISIGMLVRIAYAGLQVEQPGGRPTGSRQNAPGSVVEPGTGSNKAGRK